LRIIANPNARNKILSGNIIKMWVRNISTALCTKKLIISDQNIKNGETQYRVDQGSVKIILAPFFDTQVKFINLIFVQFMSFYTLTSRKI